ncbi:MAG TPA: hypothetical protein EYP23_06455, partial [Thermoplasmata archaeon]|nr:hypothetical protein [Thermoplasmata archaeon]
MRVVKTCVVGVLLLFTVFPAMQVFLLNGEANVENEFSYGGSSFIWEDDFFDEGKIDKTYSWNYVVDKFNGTVY